MTLMPSSSGVWGPQDGSLEHHEGDQPEILLADSVYRDFVAEASFVNPYLPVFHSWDYGFLCRYSEPATYHSISVDSGGNWHHSAVVNGETTFYEGGAVNGLRVGNGQQNNLRIEVQGYSGELYVNGELVGMLDMPHLMDRGGIAVATGLVSSSKQPGSVTGVEGFTVWPIAGEYRD
jgi:hypothetical protein